MKIVNIKENRFKLVSDKSKLLLKEQQDLETKRYRIDDKIHKLKWRRDKELREQKETHNKAQKKFSSEIDIIHKNMTSGSKNVYHNIMYNLNPKGDNVITGERFEKELSKFKDIQKTKIRTLMVARNNYIRIKIIKPKKINLKYNVQLFAENEKERKLTDNIGNVNKKANPYKDVIRFTDKNRKNIKKLKGKIGEINKEYKELEKVKPVWEGMRQSDEYYDKKEKISDKFMTLDLKKEKLEEEINKLARETNKKLFSIRL